MFPLAWLAIYTAQHSWALRSVAVHMYMCVFLKGSLAALPRARTFLASMGGNVALRVGEMCAFRAGALCLCLVVALSVGVVVTRQRSALRLWHWRPGGLKLNVAERGLLVMMCFAWPSLWILFGGGGVVVPYVMFCWLSPLVSVAAVNLRALLLGSYSQLSKSA